MASVVDEDDDGVECQGHHGRLVDEHLLHRVGGGVPLVEVYNDLFWEAHMMAHDEEHDGEYDEEQYTGEQQVWVRLLPDSSFPVSGDWCQV